MNYEIPWFIYALIVDDEIVYIGRTTQPTARRRQHRWEQRKGCNPELEVMCCSATTADAVATEAMLIAKHAPKFNVAYSPRRRLVVRHVETFRRGIDGPIPVTMRLREGMMHPNDARKVWIDGPGTMQERLARMGWTLTTAYQIFGSCGAGEAVMERARARDDEREAISRARYAARAVQADGVPASASMIFKALGPSGRSIGPKPRK